MTGERGQIGLLALYFDLYLGDQPTNENLEVLTDFAHTLEARMGTVGEVVFPRVCTNRAQVDDAVHQFDCNQVDLIVVVFLSYVPSLYVMPALQRTNRPLLLFDTQMLYQVTQDLQPHDTGRNHGMHGVQDLANVLLRANRPFQIVAGYSQDEEVMSQVQAWCDAARVRQRLSQSRVGLLGFPMESMGDFGLDETAFLAQTGVHVHHIPQQLVADRATQAPQDAIDEQIAFDHEHFAVAPDVTREQHEASSRLEWAMRAILRERDLLGFASHFFAVGDERTLDTLPFLAASKLLAEGYGYGGEGDVTSAVAVSMLHLLTGEANFTEMFTMSFGDSSVLMSHMGEGNWRVAHPGYPISLLSSNFAMTPLRSAPVSLRFTFRPGPVTLLSLTTVNTGRLRFIVTEGQILDEPPIPAISRVHAKFRPDLPLNDFLRRWSEVGGSHHQGMAYGRITPLLVKLARLLGVEYEIV